MPTPSLVSRASARVFPSSSRSDISTGQLSTVVMAAHLLPDAGAVLRLAVTPPILRSTGIAGEGPHVPPPGNSCCWVGRVIQTPYEHIGAGSGACQLAALASWLVNAEITCQVPWK